MGWQQKKSWNEPVLLTGDIDIILELLSVLVLVSRPGPGPPTNKSSNSIHIKSVRTGVVPRLVIESEKLLKFDSPCLFLTLADFESRVADLRLDRSCGREKHERSQTSFRLLVCAYLVRFR